MSLGSNFIIYIVAFQNTPFQDVIDDCNLFQDVRQALQENEFH